MPEHFKGCMTLLTPPPGKTQVNRIEVVLGDFTLQVCSSVLYKNEQNGVGRVGLNVYVCRND